MQRISSRSRRESVELDEGSACVSEPGLRKRRSAPALAFLARHAGLLTSSALALVWLVLARENPTSTYHFAPIVVAASWGVARRWVDGARSSSGQGLVSAIGGMAVAGITGAELAIVGALDGPTLWGSGSASTEVGLFVVFGGLVGYWFATTKRAGALLPG